MRARSGASQGSLRWLAHDLRHGIRQRRVTTFFIVLLVVLVGLSLRSLLVLGARSPWTSVGWWSTVVYCLEELGALVGGAHLAQLPYLTLALLVAGFVVAGRRREAQADPWWWPTRTKR